MATIAARYSKVIGKKTVCPSSKKRQTPDSRLDESDGAIYTKRRTISASGQGGGHLFSAQIILTVLYSVACLRVQVATYQHGDHFRFRVE